MPKLVLTSNQNILLNPLYYAKACNEFAMLISTSLRRRKTAPFEEMMQLGEPLATLYPNSLSRDERIVAQPTGRFIIMKIRFITWKELTFEI